MLIIKILLPLTINPPFYFYGESTYGSPSSASGRATMESKILARTLEHLINIIKLYYYYNQLV